MKILIHAINGIGLGHVIRTSRIAAALRVLRPDMDIVFVTNTKYSEILENRYKTYVLKRDTRAVIEGKYSYKDYLQYNTMAIKKIIAQEKPDGVIFDSELNRELVLFCRMNLIKSAYVLRQVIEERFLDIKEDLALFDSIIVPHVEEDFSVDQKDFLLKLHANFVGPILDLNKYSNSSIRKNILITFGAGAKIPTNIPLFSAVDSFLKYLRENNSLINNEHINIDIVTGPFYEGGCDLSGFPVRLTSESLTRDMYGAKVVISAAGYNTINEIISTKTPAVVIPVPTRWDDQTKRAAAFEKLGCIRIARNGILEPVQDILTDWQSYYQKFPVLKSGNRQAAKILLEKIT